eukprot:TRINITY_DN730_c0_g1_i1.p1 TRINITY_DN730_c0_g1~~TRINITY_DN730_c0_g1_i1.p1  ORF type:complete len:238 (-),score=53.67 TRINITY_DN730_c0_g1_i1:81-794(-)
MSVPETLIKKQRRAQLTKEELASMRSEKKKANYLLRKEAFDRAKNYEAEYAAEEKAIITNKRLAREQGSFFVDAEPKIAFVIRIRGIRGVSPKVRKILQLLRLYQVHNGVFVRMNAATRAMLTIVEPFVAYGYPSLAVVRKLVYKRGFVRINGQRIPLVDNEQIRTHFHREGLVCVEDLIHQIYTCGEHFKKVNKFFWTFNLNSPKGGFTYKLRHFVEGGDYGNRQEKISALVNRML